MASLGSGVLKKLIEEMDSDPKADAIKPVLLQVISIIPVLGEGHLWPNRGFCLKVSDSTHAIYASLPHDQDDIILCDELYLGQHIYVERLERGHPVPVLRGLTPVPGRHPCSGAPKDLILAKSFTPSGLLGSEILTGKGGRGDERKPRSKYLPSISPSKSHINNVQPNFEGAQIQKLGSNFGDKDSDSDSSRSPSCSSSLPKSTRRSWNGSDVEIIKEISEAAVAKTVTRSIPNGRRACVSPIHSIRDDSSDDNSIPKLRRKKNISVLVTKPGKTFSNNKILSKTIEETLQQQMFPCSPNDRRAERTISWDSLPPTLVNLGKDLLEQRDMAMHTAAQALQEAAAAERLLKTLRKFADFPSSKEDDPRPSVENCLKLQQELSHSRLIIELLTQISPLRTTRNARSRSSSSIKEAMEVSIQRKKQANRWIKSAVASDISPCCTTSDHILISSEDTRAAKRAVTPSRISEPKTTPSIVRRRRKGSSVIGVAPYGKDHQPQECTKQGTSLQTASELASSMEEACRKWFLEYLEDFLDKANDNANANDVPKETNYRIAGMMSQFKKVDEWIEEMMTVTSSSSSSSKEEENCQRNGSRSSEDIHILEHCKRVRNKIYMFLLNHVERTAAAIENVNSGSQDCDNADEQECISHLDEP